MALHPSPQKSLENLQREMRERMTRPPGAPSPQVLARRAAATQIETKRERKTASEIIKRFLEKSKATIDDPGALTLLEQMVENLAKIASNPKSNLAVVAFEALMSRAYGKPKPSEEEADAIRGSGLQVVFISKPDGIPTVVQPKLEAPKPEFDADGYEKEVI